MKFKTLNKEITTTEELRRHGNQNLHKNNNNNDNENNATNIVLHQNSNNCLTPTRTNDLGTLSMDDHVKESPTMIKNDDSTQSF